MNKSIGRILILIWILACIIFIGVKGVHSGWQDGPSDFLNYYSSASLLKQGESIGQFYDNEWFTEKSVEIGIKEGAKFSPFPPATAFLYLPLTVFPPLQAKRVWLGCNVILLGLLLFQMKRISALSYLEVGMLLSLFSLPIASNIRLGQSYLLFTASILSFLGSLKNGTKSFWGGGALGIAASLKYFPLIYLLYALPRREKRLMIGFVVGVIVILLLPVFTDGVVAYTAFLNEFWNHANGDLSGQGQFSYTFQSIDALLANFFIYDEQLNPNPLFNAPVVKNLIKLLFAMIVIFFTVKTDQFGKNKGNDLTHSIGVIAAMLLIPAGASYHLLLLIPSVLLLISFLRKKQDTHKYIVMVGGLIFFTCTILPHHIPNFGSNDLLNAIIHFPRLYGLVTLFICLIIIQKRYLRVED